MSDHMLCPACQTQIRFRSGMPDREWIDCPRCGEEIRLRRTPPSRRRSSRRERDNSDAPPSRRRPAPEPAPRSARRPEFVPRGERQDAKEGSAGLWVGLIGGSIGVLGLILGLIFFVNADQDEGTTPNARSESLAEESTTEDKDTRPNPAAPFQPVAANNPAHPAAPVPANNGEPTPVLGPGPDGVIPAPAAPGHANLAANDDNRLKYGLSSQKEFAYRTTITAEIGDEVHQTRGMTTYKVLGRDPEIDRIVQQEAGEQHATGTGFVVHSDGYLMTCAHVIEGATKIEVELGRQTYAARMIEINTQRDLALIRISARNLPVLPLGNSDQIQLAQHVRVVGYPLSDVLGTSVKMTQGSVAGFIDRKNGRMIQVDASMNPGNSGGPLVNDRGEAIGVASAGFFGSDISEVGLGVPANDVMALMRKNGVAHQTSGSPAKLEGPELAKQVTPSVAYLKVTMGSTPKEALVLSQFSTFSTTKRSAAGRAIGGMPSLPKSDRGKLLVNEYGEILHSDKINNSLPFGLGALSHLPLEPLSAEGETTWGTTRLTTIAQVKRTNSRFDPSSRFGRVPRSRFGRPRGLPRPRSPFERESTEVTKVHLALELSEYELTEATPEIQVINKVYDFQTIEDVEPPYFRLAGKGTIRFDRRRLLPDQIRYNLQLQMRGDDGSVARVPVEILIERFTDQELDDHNNRVADALEKNQEAARARANGSNARRPTNPAKTPATTRPAGESLDQHLAMLNDPEANFSKKYLALHAIMKIPPEDDSRKKVIDVIEPMLKDSNSSLQTTAISAMGLWGTEDRASTLIEMAGGFSRSHRWAAMKALGKIGGKKSAEAVAKRLTDKTDSLTAARALKDMGAIAEDPALEYIDHPEQPVRYNVYNLLGEVGSAKSLAALQDKAQNDPNNFNRAAAQINARKIQQRR